jgi:hypothetical protein
VHRRHGISGINCIHRRPRKSRKSSGSTPRSVSPESSSPKFCRLGPGLGVDARGLDQIDWRRASGRDVRAVVARQRRPRRRTHQ